jgi:hypothetical protein
MRIEGISEGSASQLTGHAFEQHASVRPAPTQRVTGAAQNVPTPETAADVLMDVHDSAALPGARQEVEFKLPYRVVAVGSEQKGVIDRNGDGKINLSDLPFDYFQIARQSSRKPIVQPSAEVPL